MSHFDPLDQLESKLARPVDRDAIDLAQRARERELVEVLPVLPGVRVWHEEARRRGLKLGIASSSTRAWVVGHLQRLRLDDWDCVRCSDDVGQAKPAPDLYLSVLDCLGVRAEQAIAVEDSVHGIAAAKAAGLFCVAVPGSLTAHLDLSRADLQLASLTQRSLDDVLAIAGGA